jgi:hypothetical protein
MNKESEGPPLPKLRADFVYIDASAYRSLQFDWNGRALSGLADLARRGLIRLLITAVTKREVKALVREVWSEANRSLHKSEATLRQLGFGDAMEKLASEEDCVTRMFSGFEQWLRRSNAYDCKFNPDLSAIIDDYFNGNAPFGTGKKKSEFPDAIVISILRAWCTTSKQSTYVVSHDGDLKACCTPGGPLIYAASVAEVLSHGIASATLHDAVSTAVRDSMYFISTMETGISHLSVTVERGYRRGGAEVHIEVETVGLDEIQMGEVEVESFDGTEMTCCAYFQAKLDLRVEVRQEPVRYSEDDWDSGYHHRQTIDAWVELSATVVADAVGNNEIELNDVYLNEDSIEIPWRSVERDIE